MPLLNYTTAITTEKTASEIQKVLAEFGAQGVMCEYEDKILSAISFRINTKFGLMSYLLPANIEKVHAVLYNCNSSKMRAKHRTVEQAARTAWRIIKDWIEAQLALIEAEQAEIDQVFLPYMQVGDAGKTVYQCMTTDNIAKLN